MSLRREVSSPGSKASSGPVNVFAGATTAKGAGALDEMKRYRFAFAFLCGTGFTCVLPLLLGLSSSSVLSVLVGVFLTPGGIVADLVVKPKEFSPPLLVLAANSLVYSVIAYVGVAIFGRGLTTERMRIAALRLLVPVAILVGLVCIPRLNPLWPHGMTELTAQEKALRDALPLGTGLDTARVVLRSKGIRFYEDTETSQRVILDDGMGMSITAAPGDHVISARLQTRASAFPCGYDIQLVLLFGQDENMRQQYIHRPRLCP